MEGKKKDVCKIKTLLKNNIKPNHHYNLSTLPPLYKLFRSIARQKSFQKANHKIQNVNFTKCCSNYNWKLCFWL